MRSASKAAAGQLGVIVKNVVAVRREPDDGAEQVTQALLGQPVIVEGGQGDWLFVQTWDTYRGWIPITALRVLPDRSHPYAGAGSVAVIRELFADILEKPRIRSRIITKATISNELEVSAVSGDWAEVTLPDTRTGYIRVTETRLINKEAASTMWLPDPLKLVETALRFIGVPYLWGGTSPFGFDCSGFVQLVYRIHNVTLLRDAGPQAADPRAEPVERGDLKAGDLVFFGKATEPDWRAVTHVGMVIDRKHFVHACGHSGTIVTPIDDGHPPSLYWGARRMRLATLDPGGGAPRD